MIPILGRRPRGMGRVRAHAMICRQLGYRSRVREDGIGSVQLTDNGVLDPRSRLGRLLVSNLVEDQRRRRQHHFRRTGWVPEPRRCVTEACSPRARAQVSQRISGVWETDRGPATLSQLRHRQMWLHAANDVLEPIAHLLGVYVRQAIDQGSNPPDDRRLRELARFWIPCQELGVLNQTDEGPRYVRIARYHCWQPDRPSTPLRRYQASSTENPTQQHRPVLQSR